MTEYEVQIDVRVFELIPIDGEVDGTRKEMRRRIQAFGSSRVLANDPVDAAIRGTDRNVIADTLNAPSEGADIRGIKRAVVDLLSGDVAKR